jgi:hypothetical protein
MTLVPSVRAAPLPRRTDTGLSTGLDRTGPRPEDRPRLTAAGGKLTSDVTVWVAIFTLGLLGLNWPLLGIFHESPFGYLLVFWLFFVLLVARAAHGGKRPPA